MWFIRVFHQLPVYAVDIRQQVFVEEQGFTEEFDAEDKHAIHLVGFYDGKSVATSRIIKKPDGSYMIGRIAVREEFRGRQFGARIVRAAETIIKQDGGKTIYIHSQEHASGFYKKLGYNETGEYDFEECCPHVMMVKEI